MTLDEFRQQLSQWHAEPAKVVAERLGALRADYPHEISLVEETDGDKASRTNCHLFALGLAEMDDYWSLRMSDGGCGVNGFFVAESLLPQLEPAPHPVDGVLVVFFDEADLVAHTGLVQGDRVRSKWGEDGHVWDHPALQLPKAYGKRLSYFTRPSPELVLSVYRQCGRRPRPR